MPMWNPREHALRQSEKQTIRAQAVSDARAFVKRVWLYGIPSLQFKPIAVDATWAYLARRRQDSAAYPLWALRGGKDAQERMAEYTQWVGDCYHDAYFETLCTCISEGVRNHGELPRSTPLPIGQRLSVEYLDALDADDEDSRDWSGTHPTEGAS